MEHLPSFIDLLRVVMSGDHFLLVAAWVACQLPKLLKKTSWTLNITSRKGKWTIDFHGGDRPDSSSAQTLQLVTNEEQPAKKKRSRALPSDRDTNNS